MKNKISHWYATLVAGPLGLITWLITMGIFDLTTLISATVSALAIFVSYFTTQQITHQKYLNEHELTRSEYKYIKQELKTAREKQKRLINSYKNIRTLGDIKLIFDINRVVRVIMKKVQNEPKLFYQGLQFFHSNLDSAVNMVEMYLHLYKLPGKSKEEKIELNASRLRLLELKRSLELDLSEINRPDYEKMRFEGDVLKHNKERERTKQQSLGNKVHKDRIGNISEQIKTEKTEGEFIDRK